LNKTAYELTSAYQQRHC